MKVKSIARISTWYNCDYVFVIVLNDNEYKSLPHMVSHDCQSL